SHPSRFDVNDSFSEVASTELLLGSYPIENSDGKKFVWIGPTASIDLPLTGSEKNAKIRGWAPFSLHHDRNGVSNLVIDVIANGQKIGEMRFDKNQTFEESFRLPALALAADKIRIELKSESILAPTENDKRALSIVVDKIWLD